MKICFIGYGRIAKAIIQGLLTAKTHTICVSAPSLSIGTDPNGIQTHHQNTALLDNADIVILAVKPALIPLVMKDVSASIPRNTLIISVASGILLSWFDKQFDARHAIIRAMPNIAASVAQSATPLIANAQTTAQQKIWAESIFKQVGMITWAAQESDMDAYTALSGSGPAYVFLFMDALINAGISLGLPHSIAKAVTLETIQGAVSLARDDKTSIEALRKQVTSPNGTTAAAIEVFSAHGFQSIINEALHAAFRRSQALSITEG